MSLFLEMKEYGEAASFLRKTNLEQLAAQAHAFDGRSDCDINLYIMLDKFNLTA